MCRILISCAGAVGGVKKAGVRAGTRSAVQGENGPVPESEIAAAGFNERTRSVPFSEGAGHEPAGWAIKASRGLAAEAGGRRAAS